MDTNAAALGSAPEQTVAAPSRERSRDQLLPILSGIAEALKSVVNAHTEVVVHDLTHPEASIVTIVNGHVSGRHVNQSLLAGPSGDLAFERMVRRGADEEPNAVVVVGNYVSQTRDGRSLRSASTVIYGSDRRPLAALCFNVDATASEQAYKQLERLLFPSEAVDSASDSETVAETTMEDLVSEIIERAVANGGAPTERMTKQEKMAAVAAMHARGLFLIRGSVERVARRLATTKFTIYNYLDELGLK
jgi:predicted transcriptional regulator YheO